jgi:hypothetical protein
MAETTRSAAASALAPEFGDFLFAAIGEESNGMLLSVVSALARLDVDPWQEAAKLAQLPVTAAARRLASLIAALPDKPSSHLDPAANAARLIAHLPRQTRLTAPLVETTIDDRFRAAVQSQSFRYAAFILVIVVLGGFSVAANQLSAARVHNTTAPASSAVIPSTSPPGSGQ